MVATPLPNVAPWEDGGKHIFVNVELSCDVPAFENAYKASIASQFKRTMELSSGGAVTGTIIFSAKDNYENYTWPQVVPEMVIQAEMEDGGAVGGSADRIYVTLRGLQSNGTPTEPAQLGLTGVHELLHTLRLHHPFTVTQCSDAQLIRVSGLNQYKTAPESDPLIAYNIMNYAAISINGESLRELWTRRKPEFITKGQLDIMLKNIKLQIEGEGTYLKYGYWDELVNPWGEELQSDIQ